MHADVLGAGARAEVVVAKISPEVAGALITAGSGIITNAWMARRADTAHQREVRDLSRAGLNPTLSAMGGRGAEVGNISEPVGGAVGTALAIRRLRAETALLEAQSVRERDSAALLRTQAADVQQGWNAGKWRRMSAEAGQAEVALEFARRRAEAEIESMVSSARAAKAVAVLNEAAKTGAINEKNFEQMIGRAGPATKFFLNVLRSVKGGRK